MPNQVLTVRLDVACPKRTLYNIGCLRKSVGLSYHILKLPGIFSIDRVIQHFIQKR
jgi:hypothetical protein